MAVREYNPAEVNLIVGGNIIQGYAEDTFVVVARNEQSFTLNIGSDGEGVRSKSNNFSGTLTLTLQQGSPSNDILSALNQADELNGGGVVSLLLQDANGTSLVAMETAWIQRPADQEFARESGTREWVIETDRMTTFVGGNDQLSAG